MHRGSRVIDLSHITAAVVIGEGAFISTGVLTMNDDSFAGNNPVGDRKLNAPIIGENASIGGGAILLPGVNIGDRAVVAAGSIVTKSVERDTTVMGVAAKRKYPAPIDEGLHNLRTAGYRPHDGDELVETPRYGDEDAG
jgi:acetyltransferase-like isoleucine patch superfamily enzyme